MDLLSENTPQSLRAHADQLDSAADEKLRRANTEADEMRRRAQDYRAVAGELEARQAPSTCCHCGVAIVRDAIGWKHRADTACQTPEPVNHPEQVGV